MSGSILNETNPVLQMYEAQAIIVEKNQEIDRLRQENERLRMENSNKNQLELAQKVEKLERDLASKVAKIEEDLAASKADNLQLKEQITALHLNISKNNKLSDKVEELVANQTQNAVRNENKVGKESGEQQNTSVEFLTFRLCLQVLILGGSGHLNTIYLLNSKAQSWKKLSIILPVEMRAFGAVVLNEEIYIFGGFANRNTQQDCYKLKDDGSWMKLASLNEKRAYISNSSLVYKGDIWVIGGFDGKSSLKSVEKYNNSQNKWIFFSQDKWTYMPEMNYARRYAAAAVFKDRIFVTGGHSDENLKSVEMLDPKLQKWILFCDLPIQVFGHTMQISNSTLSIFGGFSGSVILNSVWEMDIEVPEKKWTQKQRFKQPRYYFGIGKLSNGIIVFGGLEGSSKTSEIFDGNKWIYGPKLPQDLSQFAYTSIPRSLEERFLDTFS